MTNDIEKRTFVFSLELIKFCRSINIRDAAIQIILKQLLRSGTSVGANVTEGALALLKKIS
jgi:four helix bundle protein